MASKLYPGYYYLKAFPSLSSFNLDSRSSPSASYIHAPHGGETNNDFGDVGALSWYRDQFPGAYPLGQTPTGEFVAHQTYTYWMAMLAVDIGLWMSHISAPYTSSSVPFNDHGSSHSVRLQKQQSAAGVWNVPSYPGEQVHRHNLDIDVPMAPPPYSTLQSQTRSRSRKMQPGHQPGSRRVPKKGRRDPRPMSSSMKSNRGSMARAQGGCLV